MTGVGRGVTGAPAQAPGLLPDERHVYEYVRVNRRNRSFKDNHLEARVQGQSAKNSYYASACWHTTFSQLIELDKKPKSGLSVDLTRIRQSRHTGDLVELPKQTTKQLVGFILRTEPLKLHEDP